MVKRESLLHFFADWGFALSSLWYTEWRHRQQQQSHSHQRNWYRSADHAMGKSGSGNRHRLNWKGWSNTKLERKCCIARPWQMTPQGQLAPSGNVPLAPTAQNVPQPFAVILELEEDAWKDVELGLLDISRVLPGGAFGSGAIYIESVESTHIIRKVMIRMDAWMNYIILYWISGRFS